MDTNYRGMSRKMVEDFKVKALQPSNHTMMIKAIAFKKVH